MKKNTALIPAPPLEGEVMPKRPRCPFYGMMGMIETKILLDAKGNACALTCMHKDSHSPCAMEMVGLTPDWDVCETWNHEDSKKAVSAILKTFIAFPSKSTAEGFKEWSGVSAKTWFKHVMGRDYP